MQRWLRTGETYDRNNPRQVYYLSMEFLLGRSLTNNLSNLLLEPITREVMQREGLDLLQLAEQEPDAGLGNGGLGRLAACFIDSLATLQMPAIGYGLRYNYGIFRQEIQNGYQVEYPDNWLSHLDPWEVAQPRETVEVNVNATVHLQDGVERLLANRPTVLLGIPFDRPVVGYGGKTINTLRLWEAGTPNAFDLGEFSSGDFVGAVHQKIAAENLTQVLYPDDSTEAGRGLRFAQEYFLVACSLADIVRRFRRRGNDWQVLPTRDGATVEMAREAGEEHFFLFGLTAEQVQDSRGWYNPHWHYDHEPETRHALDMIRDNAFSQAEPGIFTPIWDVLLTHGDYYRHLAHLSAYIQTQERVSALYTQPDAWARQAILNVGHSGKFSSDRTIAEYAADIWQAKPCPVE